MPAIILNIIVEQGATWAHSFQPMLNGQPILATGWTARAQARARMDDPAVLYEWGTANGSLGIDVTAGAVTMTVDPAVSSAWIWRFAVYDLEVTSPDGQVTYRVAQGKIMVNPEVTR